MERGRRPLPYTGWLVLQEEVEDRIGDQPEDQIVQPEHRNPAARQAACAGGGEQRRGRPCGPDDHPQQQRQGPAPGREGAAGPSGGRSGSRGRVRGASPATSVPVTAIPQSARANTATSSGTASPPDG